MKFTCLVVDDEPLARKLLISYLSKLEGLELQGECADALEAGRVLREKPVDLVFLDIQMPQINGLQFVRTLKDPPSIILTTAYRDFAPEAFDLEVLDYLLKPISFERFVKSVNKFFDRQAIGKSAMPQPKEGASFIYLKADRKSHKVFLEDILYIESLDDYVKVHLKGTTLVTRENISSFEATLPSPQFVRIHRSFIVNAKCISTVSAESVEVHGKELPFGRAFKKSAQALLAVKGG
ncbi:MAG: LytTR family DNA-binding domain-containing protein [Cyclobacteriaceae bacterium]|nr:LytTR family DNA-binding domain-containing protein [Cyclobacteriaceae bacterium]